MIVDVTGVILFPGNKGRDCLGNGKHYDSKGKIIECCCDECNYLECCIAEKTLCSVCEDNNCPRKGAKQSISSSL